MSAMSPKTSRIPFRKYDFRFVLRSTRRYFSSWIEPEADLEFHQWKEESHCNNVRFLRGSLFKRVSWNYQSDVEIIDGWNSLLQGRSSWLQNCFEVFGTQGNEDRSINDLRVWNIHPWKMRFQQVVAGYQIWSSKCYSNYSDKIIGSVKLHYREAALQDYSIILDKHFISKFFNLWIPNEI